VAAEGQGRHDASVTSGDELGDDGVPEGLVGEGRVQQQERFSFAGGLHVDGSAAQLDGGRGGLGVRGWLQLEWAVCAQWLDDPSIERATAEAVLLGSFQGTIEGAATVSPEVAEIAARLAQALS